jgi:hypothetical protein
MWITPVLLLGKPISTWEVLFCLYMYIFGQDVLLVPSLLNFGMYLGYGPYHDVYIFWNHFVKQKKILCFDSLQSLTMYQ